jgi:Zn-dependent protease with chaperone function
MKRRLIAILALFVCVQATLAGSDKRQKEKFNGYIEWRTNDLLIVDGQRVRVVDTTKVKLRGDVDFLGDVPLGYEVKGKGIRLDDGVLEVENIELKPNGFAFFEHELSSMFDEVEKEYIRKGRVFDSDEYDNIVDDYGRLLDSGPEVERIRRITEDLVPPYLDPQDFRIYAVENSDWNAMAAPNRSIYVFTGLLEELDDDELAIILGHELAHATHEHSRRQYKRSFITELVTAVPLAIAEAHISGSAGQMLLKFGATFGLLAWENRYSRKQEDQADRVGLRYAYEAGYDVRKGPRLWLRFAKKYGNDNKALNFFFGSHSSALDRAKKLEREIALNYSGESILSR